MGGMQMKPEDAFTIGMSVGAALAVLLFILISHL